MKAGIIAAGEGSRLKAEGCPILKPLLPVEGVPLIERLIGIFVRNGITGIACIVNEASLEVKEFIESKRFPVPVDIIVKSTPSSMHSLFALAPLLRGGRFLLSTVDPVFDEGEFAAYLRHAARRDAADGVLAVTGFVDDEKPLYVSVDGEGAIVSFSKSERASLVTGGLYVFSPRIFDEIGPAVGKGIERLRNFLSHLVMNGYRLETFRFGTIVDIDRMRDVEAAEHFLRAHA